MAAAHARRSLTGALGILSMKTPVIPDLPGADSLVAWFGEWPSFHDAEILALHLDRGGVSSLKIHAWLMTRETYEKDGHRFYRTDKHAVVIFSFECIVDLELADCSSQSVISGLSIDRRDDFLRLTLSPCFGLAGYIDAHTVSVAVHPGYHDQTTSTKSPNA